MSSSTRFPRQQCSGAGAIQADCLPAFSAPCAALKPSEVDRRPLDSCRQTEASDEYSHDEGSDSKPESRAQRHRPSTRLQRPKQDWTSNFTASPRTASKCHPTFRPERPARDKHYKKELMHQNGYSNITLLKRWRGLPPSSTTKSALMPKRSPENSEVNDKLEVGYMSSRHISGLKQPLFKLCVPQLLSDH